MVLFAWLFYSVAIWTEKFSKKGLLPWMIIVFAIGFACDLVGTSIMACHMTWEKFNYHEMVGIPALVLMGLHFTWAIIAYKKHGKYEIYFHKFSLLAWGVWTLSLITGYIFK